MVLIDTSAWIHWLRPDGDRKVGDAVDLALRSGDATWCAMVLLELWNGARDGSEQQTLRRLEATLPSLTTPDAVWDEAHRCARRARRKGISVPATDLLIFACARHHGASLLHSDADFDLLKTVPGTD